MTHPVRDLKIKNGFIRMLAAESARLGTELPGLETPDEQASLASASSVRERYAPMHRLLAPDDESFLIQRGLRAAAKKLRREHRNCYFGYVARLAREIRGARRLHTLAMASEGHWSFWILLAHAVLSESSLLYLRWLGFRHAAGVQVAARDVRECLDFLIAESRFRLATS
jgi:hypothetical protein